MNQLYVSDFRVSTATSSFNNVIKDGFPFLFLGFQVWLVMQTNLGPFTIAMILIL